ncbi:hypothetical protein JCM10212_001632 [Sporobolomyces blumeae]
MRLSTLPLPLAVALAVSSVSQLCHARSSTSLVSGQNPLATLDRFEIVPRGYRDPRKLERRQTLGLGDGTGTGTDSTGTGGTGGTTGDSNGSAADSTPADSNQATSQAAATTTTAAADPATTSTSAAAQQTTTTQQTTAASPTSETTQQQTEQSPTTTTTTSAAQQTTRTEATATSASPSSPTDPAASASSAASASASTASSDSSLASSSSMSTVLVTFTSTFTNPNGSVGTSTGTTASASAVPIKQNDSSHAGRTWGIVGGVVGGVIVVAALAFVVYRCTQRRFGDLDDDAAIRWPELQPDGQTVSTNTSTLKPLDTHRTGGAGIGDDGDEWDDSEPFMGGGAGAGMGDRRQSSGTLLSMSQNREASYEQLAMVDQGGYASQQPHGHYDPFLGASSAPYPPPQNLYPPTAHYGSAGIGTGAPMGAPGAQGALREGSPPPPRDMFAAADARRANLSSTPPPRLGTPNMGESTFRHGPL